MIKSPIKKNIAATILNCLSDILSFAINGINAIIKYETTQNIPSGSFKFNIPKVRKTKAISFPKTLVKFNYQPIP